MGPYSQLLVEIVGKKTHQLSLFFGQKERLQQRAQLAARVAAEQATKAGEVMLDILHP